MKLLKYNLLKSTLIKFPIPFFCLSVFLLLPALNNEGSNLNIIPKDILINKVEREAPMFTLVTVDIRAFLQGPYNPATGTMSDALRSGASIYLPTTDPYTESPTPVSTMVDAGVFELTDANNSIVDWVLLELRDEASPATILGSKSALIQRDGDIVSEDGTTDVMFVSTDLSPASIPGAVYVAIKHRNHLAVRTPTALSTASGTVTHDFSTAQSQAYQSGISGNAAMAFVSGTISKYCMWAGDTNASGTVSYTGSGRDPFPILSMVLAVGSAGDNTNITVPGYYIEDVNMNSTVSYTGSGRDPFPILNNALNVIPAGDNTSILQQHQ